MFYTYTLWDYNVIFSIYINLLTLLLALLSVKEREGEREVLESGMKYHYKIPIQHLLVKFSLSHKYIILSTSNFADP